MTICLWYVFTHVDLRYSAYRVYLEDVHFLLLAAVVFLLMVANWCLEAEKWRISIIDERVSFWECLQVVLRGLAMNWVVPFTLGDIGGRLVHVRDHKKTVRALVLNRSIMLLITLTYGVFAILFYYQQLNSITFLSVILAVLLIIYLYTLFIKKKIFGQMPNQQLGKILSLSIVRYLIFTFQFYLFLTYFNPSLSLIVIVFGIGWVFLFRSVIPSLFGNFGVREASAIAFFQQYQPDMSLILVPCLFIWLLNTVLPSVVGAFSIINLKVNIA